MKRGSRNLNRATLRFISARFISTFDRGGGDGITMRLAMKQDRQAVIETLNTLRNQHNELQKEITRLKKAGSDARELVAMQRDIERAMEIERQKIET